VGASEKFRNPGQKLTLLNIASGPGRDLAELINENPNLLLDIDCLDLDAEAISYAKSLLPPAAPVNFIHRNIFKFNANRSYDIIWSSGLFDYFDESAFKSILTRLLGWLVQGGEIAIGNFRPNHSTYYYLQLVDWQLYHRSADELLALAKECGIPPANLKVESEPLGINMFLHIVNK
jgi:SAM-dependent methyltransferase